MTQMECAACGLPIEPPKSKYCTRRCFIRQWNRDLRRERRGYINDRQRAYRARHPEVVSRIQRRHYWGRELAEVADVIYQLKKEVSRYGNR